MTATAPALAPFHGWFTEGDIARAGDSGPCIILGFRTRGGVDYARVKPVDPFNHYRLGYGLAEVPLDKIRAA